MKIVVLLLVLVASLQAKDLGHLQNLETLLTKSPVAMSIIDKFQHKFVLWYLEAQDKAVDGSSLLRFENILGTLWMNEKSCGICHSGFGFINNVLGNKYIVELVEMFIIQQCSEEATEDVCFGAI